jgi:hypothetical protein
MSVIILVYVIIAYCNSCPTLANIAVNGQCVNLQLLHCNIYFLPCYLLLMIPGLSTSSGSSLVTQSVQGLGLVPSLRPTRVGCYVRMCADPASGMLWLDFRI